MARVALGPLIAILILLNLAIVGHNTRTYPVEWSTYCAFALARQDKPAADVFILGNSRVGRAIDPVYVSKKLEEQTGDDLRIERLSITWPDLPAYHLLAREYVRNHGYPAHLVLQLSYNRSPAKQALVGAPIHGARSVMMGKIEDLVEVQNEADRQLTSINFSNRLRRGTRPALALWIDKFTSDVFAGLRYPSWVLHKMDPDTMCAGDRADRQGHVWLYGDLPNAPPGIDPFDKGTPQDWREKAAGYLPVAPSADYRTFETQQTRSLIEFFREGGSEVSLVLLPTFSERLELGDLQEIEREFPGTRIINLIDPFNAAIADDPVAHYVDTDHVNVAGAIILSTELAVQLAEVSR